MLASLDRALVHSRSATSRFAALRWIVLALGIAFGASTQAAVSRSKGRDLYRQQCAKCHGKEGEGVKGKYEPALRGDWSIDKLARYISKNMPEDNPGQCSGPDAEAVSQFIHQSFYSRAAWARKHPARVELVRLTNRQYLNTVADLLKRFGSADSPLGTNQGLRAEYKPGRSITNATLFERLDPQVAFQFGTGHPFAPPSTNTTAKTTNDFSLTWRGSLVTDETGDHELIVRTPNGARLWLNDDTEPLIDASVASGNVSEHKATLRLIGGRAYPIKLECFKAPRDKSSSIELLWKPPLGAAQIIPARNLSPSASTPTFVLSTPFPPDDSSVGYERGVSVSKAWDEATTQAAIQVANHVVKYLDHFSHSKSTDTNRLTQIESFCTDFVQTAHRRPLTAEQKLLLVSTPLRSTPKPDEGVKRVVLQALKSARFLYLGLDNQKPDGFEVAARLSFGLWDSSPDAPLLQAAAQNQLRTQEEIQTQAQRMLLDPRTRSKMRYFLQRWVQMTSVEELAKDPSLFPSFTPEIISDLRTSLILFLDDTVWNASSDYRRLLLANELFLNDRLAQFYGTTPIPTNGFVRVAFDPKERSGVLTHPYLLAEFSYQKSTSPIHRGVFLTRKVMGRALRPPPAAVAFKDADFPANLSMREKITELTRPQSCQGCHSVINPLGFSLEHYDAIGRFRSSENGKPIDATAEYFTDDGERLTLSGARDIAEFAARSEQAHGAFIEQLFHMVVKQPMLAYDPQVMDRLRQSFVSSGFNMRRLLVDIVTVSALHATDPSKPHGKTL